MGIYVDFDHTVFTSTGDRSPSLLAWARCCAAPTGRRSPYRSCACKRGALHKLARQCAHRRAGRSASAGIHDLTYFTCDLCGTAVVIAAEKRQLSATSSVILIRSDPAPLRPRKHRRSRPLRARSRSRIDAATDARYPLAQCTQISVAGSSSRRSASSCTTMLTALRHVALLELIVSAHIQYGDHRRARFRLPAVAKSATRIGTQRRLSCQCLDRPHSRHRCTSSMPMRTSSLLAVAICSESSPISVIGAPHA